MPSTSKRSSFLKGLLAKSGEIMSTMWLSMSCNTVDELDIIEINIDM